MLVFANIDFKEDGYWPVMVLIGVLALISVGITYWRMPELRGWRFVSGFMKMAGIVLLLIALLEPVLVREVPKKGANFFLVLADNSESHQMTEKGAAEVEGRPESRGERLAKVLQNNDEGGWSRSLEERFKVHRYTFGERLQRQDDFSRLNFEERSSTLQSALADLRDRYSDRPVGGMLLFTDGNLSGFQAEDGELDFGAPVYAVNTAEGDAGQDSTIRNVVVTQSIFEDAPITVGAEIVSTQSENQSLLVSIFDESEKLLQSQPYTVPETANGEPHKQSVHFSLKPEEPGVTFYRIEVKQEGEEAPPEATEKNNVQYVVANRDKGPYRILYVAGRPMWNGRDLNRAIEADKEMSLMRLIRVAKKEPRFTFLGYEGDPTNPLYRGTKTSEDDAESYDEAVFMRLGGLDQDELASGFPLLAKDLFHYDAIILDKVEASLFRADQQALIREFVTKRGGGFLMMGGGESFAYGGWADTPIAEVLPVFIDGELFQPPTDNRHMQRLKLTREGWLEAWARLREDRTSEERRLSSLLAPKNINAIGAPKPGASVISYFSKGDGDGQQSYPALLTQQFGKGRSMAFTVSGLSLGHIGNHDRMQDIEQFWRQLCRKMIADVPRPVKAEVVLDSSRFPPTARLQMIVNDRKFDPMSDAAVSVSVTDANGDQHSLEGELSLEKPGLYTASFSAGDEGVYRATVTAKDNENEVVGINEVGWVVNPGLEEFQQLTGNVELLEELASRTDGEMVDLSELPDLVERLEKKEVPVMEKRRTPLWHSPWVLIAALILFMLEWGIKRWRGLP
jgi:hypothetical protein